MKKHLLSFAVLMISAVCLLSAKVCALSEEEAAEIIGSFGGTKLVGWEEFYATDAVSSKDYAQLTHITDGTGLFSKYMNFNVPKLGNSYASSAINYYDDASGSKGLKGNISDGDTILVKITARAANADGSEGKMRIAAYESASNLSTGFNEVTVPNVWTTFYMPATAKGAVYKINVRAGYFLQTLQIADFEFYNFGETDINLLPSGSFSLEETPMDENTVFENLISEIEGESISTGRSDFTTAKPLPEKLTAIFTDNENKSISESDMILFSFAMKAAESCKKVRITISGNGGILADMTYSIPIQWTRIYMPIETGNLTEISFDTDGEILIGEAKYENHTDKTFDDMALLSGMHMIDEYREIPLDETESAISGSKATDLIKNGNYLYTIGNGTFYITDISNHDSPQALGSISGLGTVRQIAMCEDGNNVIVTARQSGAFIIDVSNPSSPFIRKQYDTVEFATGLFISGSYAFISCRQYGVEVVDISDVDNPKHITTIRCGEAQSCYVLGNILYAGLWGECRVDMFDISDITSPVKLGSALLDGKGDGMTVRKIGDKTYLYAATGQHTQSLAVSTPLSDLRYGQGNGLDIFDVTDPQNSVWLSSSKIDGRFYYSGNDYWETELASDDSGNLYCYLVSTFNGVYIYNVNNPAAPIRLSHVTVRIPTSSPNYKVFTNSSRALIFQYNQASFAQSPIGAVVCDDGTMYLAGENTALHRFEDSDTIYKMFEAQENCSFSGDISTIYSFDGSALCDFRSYMTAGQVNAVAVKDGITYAACGNDGIIMLDENLEKIGEYTDIDCCLDIQIIGDTLYTAEGIAGASAYKVDGTSLTKLWTYKNSETIRQIRLSPDCRFAVLVRGQNMVEVINTETRSQVLRKATTSLIYTKSISNHVVDNRYIVFCANSSNTCVIDFGENGSLDTPVLSEIFSSSAVGMNSGYEAAGTKVLGTNGKGYILYSPGSPEAETMSALPSHSAASSFAGKPSIGGNTLVTSDRINGNIYIVDITDITKPTVKNRIKVAGNPEFAVFDGNDVIVPMGHQGIFRFAVSDENTGISAGGKFVKISGNPVITRDTEVSGYCFTSAAKVTLYRVDGETETAYAVFTESENGASSEIEYSFCSLEDGDYYVTVEKNGYIKFTSPVITVSKSGENSFGTALLVAGDISESFADICGDGKIDAYDFIRLLRSFDPSSSQHMRDINDINEDGYVTVEDLAYIKMNYGKS